MRELTNRSGGQSDVSAPVYALAQISIHDRARYLAYAQRFGGVLARYAGELLAADEAPTVVEGAWDRDKVILLRFNDERSYLDWAQSEDYQTISRERVASTQGTVLLVHGLPARGASRSRAESSRYDAIGSGYARVRREDPELRAQIHAALGDARSIVNVGAGAGSYEPRDRYVIAVEPSAVMAAQRTGERVPAIRARADRLPLFDRSVDAAMSVLSLHHWDQARERGARELRRVARGPVVIVTYDPRVSGQMWLMAEYLPEVATLDHRIFPVPEQIAQWLGGDVRIEPLPLSRTTPDWMLGSYWAHPERVLDPEARAATSGFARMPEAVVERVVCAVQRDLQDGSWDRRHGALRTLPALDVGLRMIVAA